MGKQITSQCKGYGGVRERREMLSLSPFANNEYITNSMQQQCLTLSRSLSSLTALEKIACKANVCTWRRWRSMLILDLVKLTRSFRVCFSTRMNSMQTRIRSSSCMRTPSSFAFVWVLSQACMSLQTFVFDICTQQLTRHQCPPKKQFSQLPTLRPSACFSSLISLSDQRCVRVRR
jgi:hypothetical protein